jgi:hypothetical protein
MSPPRSSNLSNSDRKDLVLHYLRHNLETNQNLLDRINVHSQETTTGPSKVILAKHYTEHIDQIRECIRWVDSVKVSPKKKQKQQ